MQNNQIDWSKAPELATHYMPGMHFPWCKGRAGIWEFWTGYVWQSFGPSRVTLASMIERPSAWNGEGLPPVGTVCEAYDHETKQWVAGRLLMHGNSDHAFASGTPECWNKLFWAGDFRPIRTPEQIAAEEREKAIDKLIDASAVVVDGTAYPISDKQAAAIYDAGYRLVEGGAQ